MLQQLLNCFKGPTGNETLHKYEKDVLSSLMDVLPSHQLKSLEHKENPKPANMMIDLNRKTSLMSPDDQPTKFNFSSSESEPDEQGPQNQYCKLAMDYFSLGNKVRIVCIHLYESRTFHVVLHIYTLVHSLILLLQPKRGISSGFSMAQSTVDGFGYASIAINFIHHFVCTMTLGIWNHKFAFYRDPVALINLLAFLLIIILQRFDLNIFRILFIVQSLSKYKLFSLTMRLSQTIKHKLVTIFYIIMLMLYFQTVYAIIGQQIWSKQLDGYCMNQNSASDTYPARMCGTLGRTCPAGYECKKGTFKRTFEELSHEFTSYDTLPNSLITTFVLQQVEGYVEIEQALGDTVNPFLSGVYCWSYIIMSSFFLTNLIVAVYLQKYQTEIKVEEPPKIFVSNKQILSLTDRRRTLFSSHSLITNSRRRVIQLLSYNSNHPDNKTRMRYICKKIVTSLVVKYLYSILFVANLIIFSFNNENASESQFESVIAFMNFGLVSLYLIEDFLRLYIWHKKDSKYILLLEALIDFVSFIGQAVFWEKPFVLNSLKGLRLLWFFNSQQNWSNYKVLLSALHKSFVTAPNMILLLFTFTTISGIIGRDLYAGLLRFNPDGSYSTNGLIVPRANFESIRDVYTSLSMIISTDQWQTLYYTTQKSGDWTPHLYFICVLSLCKLLILPSFLTVVLNNYDEAKSEAEKQRTKAEKVINQFRKTTRAQVTPIGIGNLTPQEKKRYFGRCSQISDESQEPFTPIHHQAIVTHTVFQRQHSKVPPVPLSHDSQINQTWSEHLKNCSFFILHNRHYLRRRMLQLSQQRSYELFISLFIIASMLVLAFDKPLRQEDSTIDNLNIVITSLFIGDVIFKSLAQGFLINSQDANKAYIRNPQNLLDSTILILTAVNDFGIYRSGYLNCLKSLRFYRILVAMRRGSENEKLNLLSGSLLQTISLLSSMLFVSGISIWILSIFCMTLWKGQLYFCSGISSSNIQEIQKGGEWINSFTNFDTIQDALVSLFRLIIGEGWVALMFAVSDITGRDSHPFPNASSAYQYLFYILLLVLNIMLLNLFYGLIINNYRTIKENIENLKALNTHQRQWVEMIAIMQKKKLITLVLKPSHWLRGYAYLLATHSYYELIVAALLVVNLILAATWDNSLSPGAQTAYKTLHLILISVFHVETILKLMAFGTICLKEMFNRLDIIILLTTDFLLILESQVEIPRMFLIPLILRTFRIGSLPKLVHLNKTIKVLLDVLRDVIPTLASVIALIIIVTIVYALIGLQIFSVVKSSSTDPQYPYYQEYDQRTLQFYTFHDAFLILLEISTGQFWTLYLVDYAFEKAGCHSQTYEQSLKEGVQGCGTFFAYPYFISYLILIRIIMLSLFLAMIIESYSDCVLENQAVIKPYQMDDFLVKWSDYDPSGTGWLNPEDFAFLMFELPQPLGFKDENPQYFDYNPHKQQKASIVNYKKKMNLQKKDILKNLRNFYIPIYKNNKIHFKDVCIQISHNAVCSKNSLDAIEALEDKIVQGKIKKSWESAYPDLYGHQAGERLGFVVEIFAAISIQKIWKDQKEQKKIKKITKDNYLQNKLKKLDQTDASYLTKQNAEEQKHRRKSLVKRRQNYQGHPRQKADAETGNISRRQDRRSQQFTNPSQFKVESRQSSLQSHNFYIEASEMYNGFPMKVSFETQKIDFADVLPNTGSISAMLNTDQLQNSVRLKQGISEKCSDEENQDSIVYKINHNFDDF